MYLINLKVCVICSLRMIIFPAYTLSNPRTSPNRDFAKEAWGHAPAENFEILTSKKAPFLAISDDSLLDKYTMLGKLSVILRLSFIKNATVMKDKVS